MTSHLPVPAPERSPETDPFWEGTADGVLRLAHCDACDAVLWYPKTYCSECGGTAVSWIEASGKGTIYSFSVVRRGTGAFREAAPFVVAYVELVEGPRVLTNIVGCEPETTEPAVRSDMRSLPHTREATARSAAMDEGLGDGTGS